MKKVLLICMILFFAGCSSKMNFKSDFRKNNSLNNEYKITGNIERLVETGFFSATIKNVVSLYINNKLVIKTALNDDFSGRTELYFDSKPLIVECGKDNVFSQPKCIILLDGQNLGTLDFQFDFNR